MCMQQQFWIDIITANRVSYAYQALHVAASTVVHFMLQFNASCCDAIIINV